MIDVNSRHVINKPIRVDGGINVYVCQFSKKEVLETEAIFLGPILPNLSKSYTHVCHPDGIEARKQSKKWFDESERNCNTCKKLERVPHEKRGGFMRGKCEPLGEHQFHPDDPMNMECWESR